jgi:hypothetical protein
MFRKICFIGALLLPLHTFAAIDSVQMGVLSDKNAQIKAKINELDNTAKALLAAKAKKKSAVDSLDQLEAESDKALDRLETLQKIDRESPDTIAPEKLKRAEDDNRQAIAALKSAKTKRDAAAAEVTALNNNANEQYAEFQRLQNSFERDMDSVVNARVDQQIRALQSSKEVTVTARVACGDESPKACKEKSAKAAEQAASERGSVVFVTSLTEIKNFKLSKEEVSSEVRATLTNKEILKQQMFGEAEAYETTLKARVDPVIGDNLRDQMAEGIRAEVYAAVGGKVEYEQVRNPGVTDEIVDAPKRKDAGRNASASTPASRKAAREEEARRRAEDRERAAAEARAATEARLAAQAAEERRRATEERIRVEDERRRVEGERRKAEDDRRRSAAPTFSF